VHCADVVTLVLAALRPWFNMSFIAGCRVMRLPGNGWHGRCYFLNKDVSERH
jgi:hypothetical protein